MPLRSLRLPPAATARVLAPLLAPLWAPLWALVPALSTSAPAQPVWTQLSPANNPGYRQGHAMAFDASRGVTILYGGARGSTTLGDTWSWDGTNWQQLFPVGTTPGPRDRAWMCYHAARGQVLLISQQTDATWAWNGTSWVVAIPSGGTLPQGDKAVAYDPVRNVVVVFEGARTWEWTGTGFWTQKITATSPALLLGAVPALAWDAAAGKMLLFYRDQTWTYDGTSWTQLFPAASPPARYSTAVCYDSARGEVVMFGGYSYPQSLYLDDTWVWNGSKWTQQIAASTPPARIWHGLAYDSVRQQAVLYSGHTGSTQLSDTWIKNPTFGTPAQLTPYGSGCPGTSGTPQLGGLGGSLPWIGGNLVLELRSLPPLVFRAPFGLLGFSRTAWGSIPLPLDMAPVGMPGCPLHVSLELVYPLTNQLGTAQWTLVVPPVTALVGQHLFAQGLVVDPQVNLFGAVLSNAVDGTIGAR